MKQLANALPTFDQSARKEDYHHHKQQAQSKMPALAHEGVDKRNHYVLKAVREEGQPLMQNAVVYFGQDIFEILVEPSAQYGTDQCTDAAQD